MIELSVIVPVYNERELLRRCLRSVVDALATLELHAELIVVDDASADGAAALVREEFPAAQLFENEANLGFAPTANRGMRAARGRLLLLLNSDTELCAAALQELISFLEQHEQYAGVAPRLVGADGITQRSLMAFPSLTTALFFATPLERWMPNSRELVRYFQRELDHECACDAQQPPAAAWLLRRCAWEAVGEFDEELELFFNDVDWCLRLAATGGKLRYLASAPITHHGGASTRHREDFVARWQTDRLRYYSKHFGPLGALWVKLCVGLSFSDWCLRNLGRRMLGRTSEPLGPTSRAFTRLLRARAARQGQVP